MRIAHCADWHLSSQRGRLDPETALNARLIDFYRCARFSIEDGIQRGADLVVHCGDVFNGCRPTPTEVRLAKDAFASALELRIPVVVVKGNHDDVRMPAERHALDLLRETPNLTVVDQPTVLFFQQLETNERTFLRPCGPEQAEIQIACLPWPNKQLLLADAEYRKLDPGALNLLVREKMMDVALGLAAQLVPNVPAVLVGHFSVDLAQAGGQNRLMMLGGEWTLNAHELAALPFCYFALGHIHKPQRVWFDGPRSMVYCGSPEAVTFGEEGEEKGYVLVSVEPDGAAVFERVATPYRRFITIGLDDLDEDGRLLHPEALAGAIVRVRLPEGCAAIRDPQFRRDLEAAGAYEYQIETQRAETVRRRAVEVSSEMALDEALKAWLAQRPDRKPMTEAVLAEARTVEQALQEGGAP